MKKCPTCGAERPSQAQPCQKCGYLEPNADPGGGNPTNQPLTVSELPTVNQLPAVPSAESKGEAETATISELPTANQLPAVEQPSSTGGKSEATNTISELPTVDQLPAVPSTENEAQKKVRPQQPSPAYYSRAQAYTTARLKVITTKAKTHKKLTIAVVAAVVLAGTGLIWYLLLPRPELSITSKYKTDGVPAAANGTMLHIRGEKFASNSLLTFQLDGKPVTGKQQQVKTDSEGKVDADILVTNGWQLGRHILTARDAAGSTSVSTVPVVIVTPGQAHTPGLNGAPPDNTTFSVHLTFQALQDGHTTPRKGELTFKIIGRPDPQGGQLCLDNDDQTGTENGTTVSNGASYTGEVRYRCSGSYKGGKITYTQTMISATFTFDDGSICRLNSPQDVMQISGTYGGNQAFAGIVTYNAIPSSYYTCTKGDTFEWPGGHGTWSGTIIKD